MIWNGALPDIWSGMELSVGSERDINDQTCQLQIYVIAITFTYRRKDVRRVVGLKNCLGLCRYSSRWLWYPSDLIRGLCFHNGARAICVGHLSIRYIKITKKGK